MRNFQSGYLRNSPLFLDKNIKMRNKITAFYVLSINFCTFPDAFRGSIL